MSVEKVSEDRLSLYNLPGDIYDLMAAFLDDPDLFRFLTLSRHIIISSYLLRDRRRALWTKCDARHLAIKGDLAGLQYLHSLGSVAWTTYAMDCAARNEHLAVVQYLHSIGATCTTNAMDWAASKGHLAVVEFLHGIGAPYTTNAMDWAAHHGHLAVVQFLHSVAAPYTTKAMKWAARNGHLAVVGFLSKIKN
jgi:hypothetical protein